MEILNFSDDVVGIHVAGKITKADIEALRKDVEDKLQRHPRLGVYVELESLQGISIEGLLADIKLGLAHFNSFSKKAVVSDKSWLDKLVPTFNRVFPSIDLRSFSPAQRAEAQAWVRPGTTSAPTTQPQA